MYYLYNFYFYQNLSWQNYSNNLKMHCIFRAITYFQQTADNWKWTWNHKDAKITFWKENTFNLLSTLFTDCSMEVVSGWVLRTFSARMLIITWDRRNLKLHLIFLVQLSMISQLSRQLAEMWPTMLAESWVLGLSQVPAIHISSSDSWGCRLPMDTSSS